MILLVLFIKDEQTINNAHKQLMKIVCLQSCFISLYIRIDVWDKRWIVRSGWVGFKAWGWKLPR